MAASGVGKWRAMPTAFGQGQGPGADWIAACVMLANYALAWQSLLFCRWSCRTTFDVELAKLFQRMRPG
jgi:hypothetical protein